MYRHSSDAAEGRYYVITLVFAIGTFVVFVIVFLRYTIPTLIAIAVFLSVFCPLNAFVQTYLLRCPSYQVPFLGLPATGKTALICCLCGEINRISPPRRYKETLSPRSFKFCFSHSTSSRAMQIKSTDFGGRRWKSYALEHMVHGAIFVVDASNSSAMDASRDMLERILARTKLNGRPILVLANKADRPGGATPTEIKEALNLPELRHGSVSWEQARLVAMGGLSSCNTDCPLSWVGGDVLRLISEYTGTGENQEKVISDPFLCSATNRTDNYELADGLSWLMDRLMQSEDDHSSNEPVVWWYDKLLRWARINLWVPETSSFQIEYNT